MISSYARPFVVASLLERLAEVDRALAGKAGPYAEPIEPASDPEEALRELMVQHLPRARSLNADRRARVCCLLAGLAGEARGSDVRFLDAFNTWFEHVDGLWQTDGAWRRVMAAYAATLRAVIADLQSVPSGAARRAAFQQETGSVPPAPQPGDATPANPRVLILAEHWAGAWRILRGMRGLDGLAVHTLICNNSSSSAAVFRLRQAIVALTTGVRGVFALLAAMCRHRLHLRGCRLHDEATLEWLRNERFWIGLHAMGVIYREPVFAAFGRGVLNAHIGLLPEYRGRSVMEWSILGGAPTGVSVFFMDPGIDTGREIVLRRTFEVGGAAGALAAKATLFQRDGEMYRAALQVLLEGRPGAEPVNEGGRRYFVMSRLLMTVVDGLVASRASDATWETQACISMA